MKERPILFNGEMVRAILDGRKTQTRREMKARIPPWITSFGYDAFCDRNRGEIAGRGSHPEHGPAANFFVCPFGKRGDRLWVRETFAVPEGSTELGDVAYRADHPEPTSAPWRPSIHMPRWASRITLEITGVRVERLQDISNSDIIDEGIHNRSPGPEYSDGYPASLREMFEHLWNSTGGNWGANPWVWVIEFKRVKT